MYLYFEYRRKTYHELIFGVPTVSCDKCTLNFIKHFISNWGNWYRFSSFFRDYPTTGITGPVVVSKHLREEIIMIP